MYPRIWQVLLCSAALVLCIGSAEAQPFNAHVTVRLEHYLQDWSLDCGKPFNLEPDHFARWEMQQILSPAGTIQLENKTGKLGGSPSLPDPRDPVPHCAVWALGPTSWVTTDKVAEGDFVAHARSPVTVGLFLWEDDDGLFQEDERSDLTPDPATTGVRFQIDLQTGRWKPVGPDPYCNVPSPTCADPEGLVCGACNAAQVCCGAIDSVSGFVSSHEGYSFPGNGTGGGMHWSFEVTICGVPATDANNNGVHDPFETNGVDIDCNGTPDQDLCGMPWADADSNGVNDGWERAGIDTNCDGTPDRDLCNVAWIDANANGVNDVRETAGVDVNCDGVPDKALCNTPWIDMDMNGAHDGWETSGLDINCDGRPDQDLCRTPWVDSDANGVNDAREARGIDVNCDGVPDEDLCNNRWRDENGNGLGDAWEQFGQDLNCDGTPDQDVCGAPWVDSDGDSLLDQWETGGVDTNCDGTIDVPIHLWGASRTHKDLFVQYNWCPGHAPSRSLIEQLRAMYAQAPLAAGGVPNPDGRPGITLHVDARNTNDPTAEETGGGGTCADRLDNDGDGLIDRGSCSDGVDNDGNRLTDAMDPACTGPQRAEAGDLKCLAGRNREISDCNDRVDNREGDGLADGADPQCRIGDDFGAAAAGGELASCAQWGVPNLTRDNCPAAEGTCRTTGIWAGTCSGSGKACSPDNGFAAVKRAVFPDARRRIFRFVVAAPGAGGLAREDNGINTCIDRIDNDGDGNTDAADPNCMRFGFEHGSCTDGIDNFAIVDGADRGDATCAAGTESGAPGAGNCFDGRDNDGDMRVDAADPQCQNLLEPPSTTPGSCYDHIDNAAGDGADGMDPTCRRASEAGPGGPDDCHNMSDDDMDMMSLVDKDDPECAAFLEPPDNQPGSCYDGKDNAFDGFDGADDDCNWGGGWNAGADDIIEFNHDPGTVAHELGHSLGLGHGGGDGSNCKPNYLSVMNYDHQGGVLQNPGVGSEGGGMWTCTDGRDNDLDGARDGNDPDCFGQDTNNDGLGDGIVLDYSAVRRPVGEVGEGRGGWSCADGVDNDGDGLFDNGSREGGRASGTCFNGLDDDGNRQTDAMDRTCAPDPDCDGVATCTDGRDNDGDLLSDAMDPDCQGRGNVFPNLREVALDEPNFALDSDDEANRFHFRQYLAGNAEGAGNCSDGMDNDGDRAIDAADFDSCIGLATTAPQYGNDRLVAGVGDGVPDGIDWNGDGDFLDRGVRANPDTGGACGPNSLIVGQFEDPMVANSCSNMADDDSDTKTDDADVKCMHHGWDDWQNIRFSLRNVVGVRDAAFDQRPFVTRELTREELVTRSRAVKATDLAVVTSAASYALGGNGDVDIEVTIENRRAVPAFGPIEVRLTEIPEGVKVNPQDASARCVRVGGDVVCQIPWIEGWQVRTLRLSLIASACDWAGKNQVTITVRNPQADELDPTNDRAVIAVRSGGIWPMWRMCASGWGDAPFDGPIARRPLWSLPLLSPLKGSIVIDDDRTLYAATELGKVYALSATGQTRWQTLLLGSIPTAPAITSQDLLVVATKLGIVYGIRKSNGQTVWSRSLGATIPGAPIVAGDTIYVTTRGTFSSSNALVALTFSGTEKWKRDLPGPSSSSVAIGSNGEIVVGTERPVFGTARLLAYDQAGTSMWSKPMPDSVLTAPSIRAGRVYVGTKANTLEALDLSNGNSLWSYAVPCPRLQNCDVGAAPAVTADRLVVFGTQNGTIYGVQDDNTRGVLVWDYDTWGAITGSPILSRNGLAYIGSENSHLYALDTTTGEVEWEANTFASIKSTPSLDNQSVLYVGSNDGFLRTFGP